MIGGFKTPTMEQNQQAKTALCQAWDEGILDPLYFYPQVLDWTPPEPDADAVRLLAREPPAPRRNDRITDQLDEPALDTRAQWYQDISYFHAGDQVQAQSGHEVARFITTGNETGFVNLCWTWAEILAGAPPAPVVELDPRDPFAVQNAIAPLDCYWFLRLEQGNFQKAAPPPLIAPINQIPGYGYSPLPRWRDYRFQWGRTNASVFILVPAQHALRLYFFSSGQSNIFNGIGGRLRGWTQPSDVRPTGWNVAHGWS